MKTQKDKEDVVGRWSDSNERRVGDAASPAPTFGEKT